MARKQIVTIKEVARAAGVSTQTVSRVINHRPDVSLETKKRVQNIIDELGYSPNVLARSLVRGRSNTLGVVGLGLGYFGPTSILKGIEKRSYNLGFSLLLSLLDDFDPSHIDAIVKNLMSRQVEGIIWAVPGNKRLAGQLTVRFKDISIPVVYLNKSKRVDDLVVALDNQYGARLATEHLLAQGYRHIGLITGPMDWWEAQQREVGWRQVMQDAGNDDLDKRIAVGDWSAISGNRGLQELLSKSPQIDAVFACNDQMALGVLQAARQMGKRIPEDLAIVGFDDIPEAAFFYPPLTTIGQDAEELGAQAVDQMCNFIRARQQGEEYRSDVVWVKPRLIVRESSVRD